MTNLQAIPKESPGALIAVLQNSLYAGASSASVAMVLDYCAAARLDPMQKPVHIVPMRVKDPVSGQYGYRDVIMPGIGLYRIQADRSGSLAGISAPQFGELIEHTFRDKEGGAVTLCYPEWCEVTVHKLIGAHIVAFAAREYWFENYATDSNKSTAPNAMWRKRPRGQIAKCAESQALRKAFPEIGAAPSAEEMEGKTIDDHEYIIEQPPAQSQSQSPHYPSDQFEANLPTWRGLIEAGKRTPENIIAKVQSKGALSEAQLARIRGEQVEEELA